ncbi:MAG: hypothetical protein KC420_02225 [Myxococcales bacterium]|nr:hypothetical protein [Myxococcales bacterium]
MGGGIQALFRASACHGDHLIVGGQPDADPELALASLLFELESDGAEIRTVSLRLARRADAAWAQPALRWLAAHGRRPLLRSAISLPRPLAEAAWESGASVVFELAHQRPAIQRALVGPEADPAAALLLSAQHLGRLGVGVGAHLGPLVPGIHDHRAQVEPLLHHLRAADLHEVHLSVGRLTPARLAALAGAVDEGVLLAIRRAYGVAPGSTREGWRLGRLSHDALREGVRAIAREHGLRVDGCGCAAFCHLDGGGRPDYARIGAGELFADVAG